MPAEHTQTGGSQQKLRARLTAERFVRFDRGFFGGMHERLVRAAVQRAVTVSAWQRKSHLSALLRMPLARHPHHTTSSCLSCAWHICARTNGSNLTAHRLRSRYHDGAGCQWWVCRDVGDVAPHVLCDRSLYHIQVACTATAALGSGEVTECEK